MKCIPIEQLNNAAKSPAELVADGEKVYAEQIEHAAQSIFERRNERPVVLLSGPSGSGKTTSAHRIAALLESYGCKAHTISMDNYFLPMQENEAARDENGIIDISGDYNHYPVNKTITLENGVKFAVRGDEDNYKVANFATESGYYSIICTEGMKLQDIEHFYKLLEEAEAPRFNEEEDE